jgi:Subtilase family
MRTRTRHPAWLAPLAAGVALALPVAPARAQAGSPQPSEYAIRPACATPARGHVACMALRLVPRTAAARAHPTPLGRIGVRPAARRGGGEPCEPPTAAEGCIGLRPQDLHSAYQLPREASTSQTIALVDAYNDPTAEADLRSYSEALGLPLCTTENGCFEQVNELGETANLPFPATTAALEEARLAGGAEAEEAKEAEGWSVEISLDIETAHATCENCRILLVEAASTSTADLDAAEQAAVSLGAGEISNSWGAPECIEAAHVRECEADDSPFDHPGIVITASAGDSGYLDWDEEPTGADESFADFPASSPDVVAVGGTRLLVNEAGARVGESVWNDGGESAGKRVGYGAGGGGCSVQLTAQPWQQQVADWSQVGCGERRAVADVSADADPFTGLAVHDTSSEECVTEYVEVVAGKEVEAVVPGWCTIGGTSLSSPLIASVFALAGGAHGVAYPARTLYENALATPSSLHDVTIGSNGECTRPFDRETAQSGCTTSEQAASCAQHLICRAASGYDGPSGLGTPNGLTAFEPPAPAPGGGGGGGGTQPASNWPAPALGSAAAPAPASGAAAHAAATVRLSRLALTPRALVALNTSHPKIGKIGFSFLSNVPVRVSVLLQRRVGRGRRARWRALAHPLQMAAVGGRNSGRLSGHGGLGAGTYRLTLMPRSGSGSSLVFKIG